MRLFLIFLALLFVAAGAIFSALNGEPIAIDFYFARFTVAKGALLLVALLVGWIVGGLVVYVGMVPRLRRRVRALARQVRNSAASEVVASEAPTKP